MPESVELSHQTVELEAATLQRRLYTPAQAADLLAVKESWLRRQAGQRKIPCTFVGKHLRFSHADLNTITQNGRRPARAPRKRFPHGLASDTVQPGQGDPIRTVATNESSLSVTLAYLDPRKRPYGCHIRDPHMISKEVTHGLGGTIRRQHLASALPP
jgi:excisionase family DNA binding protein